MLSLLALVVMILLLVLAVVAAVLLGGLPGRIAQRRDHPQADAIRMCGWMGLLTRGGADAPAGVPQPVAYDLT